PKTVIGKTTETSMQAGIMFGSVELVNGIVRRITKELGHEATILATGGIAPQLLENLEKETAFRPFLTLKGLQIIYSRNSK
ncbi:type III pantothenate kinase, partial [candidate division KSB1 bacterium]|nr:type III pantothenate kinase [candidate division KSB1 bacterium]